MNQSLRNLKRIVHYANPAISPEEQTQSIADAVCQAVEADIYSLYLVDSDSNLQLLATATRQPRITP